MSAVALGVSDVRSFNIGNSDYAEHKIQPWDVWIAYRLNPFHADMVKRLLRTKAEGGMSLLEARRLDYEKIKHIAMECKRQNAEGIAWFTIPTGKPVSEIPIADIIREYDMDSLDASMLTTVLSGNPNYDTIILACERRIEEIDSERRIEEIDFEINVKEEKK